MSDVATLHALLSHIGIREQPDADAAGLRVIHRAFLTHIAYDGITAQLGEYAPLDPDALIERTLRTGRGGYCFEINTILLTLLEALGFGIERRQGVVGPRDAFAQGLPTNHLALVATVRTGEAYICDAGWGEGPLDPIPLTAGTVGTGPLSWTVAPEDGGAWWVGQHAWGSTPDFRFGATPEPLDAFAPHHERLASSPASSFAASSSSSSRPTTTRHAARAHALAQGSGTRRAHGPARRAGARDDAAGGLLGRPRRARARPRRTPVAPGVRAARGLRQLAGAGSGTSAICVNLKALPNGSRKPQSIP